MTGPVTVIFRDGSEVTLDRHAPFHEFAATSNVPTYIRSDSLCSYLDGKPVQYLLDDVQHIKARRVNVVYSLLMVFGCMALLSALFQPTIYIPSLGTDWGPGNDSL